MPLPKGQTEIILPFLKRLKDGQEHDIMDVIDHLAGDFALTEDELKLTRKSGESLFRNRVYFAVTTLKISGLLEYTARRKVRITEAGKNILINNPPEIMNHPFLMKNCPPYAEYRKEYSSKETRKIRVERKDRTADQDEESKDENYIPEEKMEEIESKLETDLEIKLIDKVLETKPDEFERLVIKLLAKMGYAGGEASGIQLGRTGDNGVDGVVEQDVLGVNRVYLQAKRYGKTNTVGSGAIRDFSGALHLKRAQSGVFITTSLFSKEAQDTAKQLGVILIDGDELTSLMHRFNIGCQLKNTYEVKEIDEDFFDNL